MALHNIKKSAREVAEAISAVLNVDVTIIDQNLNRIASTGEYKTLIGKRLPKNCSFEQIFKMKKFQFIDSPHNNEHCFNCDGKGNCKELATIGYPIVRNDECVGIIGINAFDEKQKFNMQKNYEHLITFLGRLSDLLVGNLNYYDTIAELSIEREETNMIINEMDKGIICIDSRDKIKYVNSKVQEFLNISREDIINKRLIDIFPQLNMDLNNINPRERRIKISGKNLSFIIRNIPVLVEEKKVSNILEIYKTSSLVRDVFSLINGENMVTFDNILGTSKEIRKVKDIARYVSDSDSTVLLRGESGTGKELFARAIHCSSPRKRSPFIAINCASIPDNLLESELFGYEGGAFTSAKKEGQMGKLELANGGTLFLDEIGDLPLHLQPKLLRVLQEQAFRRIGGKELISVNFRLITATNRDLEKMVANREFRDDLYYRLNVIPIVIPPLRDRKGDILLLSEYNLKKYCMKLEKSQKYFSDEVKQIFMEYGWPGNIREIENVVEYLVNVTKDDIITSENLPITMKKYFYEQKRTRNGEKFSLKNRLDEFEEQLLISMLGKHDDTTQGKQAIADELDIDLSTLYRKLAKYNLQK